MFLLKELNTERGTFEHVYMYCSDEEKQELREGKNYVFDFECKEGYVYKSKHNDGKCIAFISHDEYQKHYEEEGHFLDEWYKGFRIYRTTKGKTYTVVFDYGDGRRDYTTIKRGLKSVDACKKVIDKTDDEWNLTKTLDDLAANYSKYREEEANASSAK